MKKKRMTIIIAAAIVVVGALSAAYFLIPKEPAHVVTEDVPGTLELIALVNSEEEGKQLAEAYEIEFLRFGEGVAVFRTGKPYEEILEIGKTKGLTELSLNDYNSAF